MSRLGFSSVLLAVLLAAGAVRGAEPLDFVPDSVQIVATVERPRKLVEAFTALDASQEAKQLEPVKKLLDSTPARRFFQMLGHLERELGAAWPELLDQLAGRGIAVAGHFGDKPALLVLQGTDEKQIARAFDLSIAILGDELQRQGVPLRPKRETKNGVDYTAFGDFHAARTGATILVSNKAEFLDQALRVAAARTPGSIRTKSSFIAATKLLPRQPLLKLWIDFASTKQDQASKDFFAATRKDFLQTLVAGGTIDCLRRSDFIVAGLFPEKAGLRFALRLPAGRGEFPPELAFHAPLDKTTPGSLPLLEPPGVVLSQSIYLDIGFYWKNRDRLINDEMRKQLEMGEKQLTKILPGNVEIGKLLETWGPYHRGVVLAHDRMPYKSIPTVRFPAFGYVASMRDPKFGRSLESVLRETGLFLSLVYGLKQTEFTHDGAKIVAYRFSETKPFDSDPEGIRFNFEPCFAQVDDQFIAASTVEACKKLIAEVRRTAKRRGSPAVWRGKAYAVGAERLLYDIPDPLITDAILTGGLSLDAARTQVNALGAWLKKRGTVRIEIDEAQSTYKLDVVWTR